jgi:hypothetical protein
MGSRRFTVPLLLAVVLAAVANATDQRRADGPDHWRYVAQDGLWWYWTPDGRWVYWWNNQWREYSGEAACLRSGEPASNRRPGGQAAVPCVQCSLERRVDETPNQRLPPATVSVTAYSPAEYTLPAKSDYGARDVSESGPRYDHAAFPARSAEISVNSAIGPFYGKAPGAVAEVDMSHFADY